MAEIARRKTRVRSAFARDVLAAYPGFHWLDKRRTWFRVGSALCLGLAHAVTKILSVAGRIEIGAIYGAVLRSWRRGQALPPRGAILEYCRHMPGTCVEGRCVISDPPRDWRKDLSGVERTMVEVLTEHGPVMERPAFEAECLQRGMNRCTFNVMVTNSPVVVPCGHCLYKLIGTRTPRRAAPRRWRRALPRVLRACGRTEDGKTYAVYRLSEAVVSGGLVTMPSASRARLHGKFAIRTPEGRELGEMTAKDGCAWGLAPALREAGARQGDQLLLIFDAAQRVADFHLGEPSVLIPSAPGRLPDQDRRAPSCRKHGPS